MIISSPIFSVIIPVYNSEEYLSACVESIQSQTLKEFEIILVDDGSTDNSLKLCNQYADNDERIQVFHQKNQGQGSARNLGLCKATGDYIMFVDSDDEIASNTLLDNYRILKSNPSIQVLQYPVYYSYGTEDAFVKKSSESIYQGSKELTSHLLNLGTISWIVCDKIFRSDVLKNKLFREDIKYEDNYFLISLIPYLDNVYISGCGMYYYFYRPDSTTTSPLSLLKEKSTYIVLQLILDMVVFDQNVELKSKYLIRLINVNKSIRCNFKVAMPGHFKYRGLMTIMDVIKSKNKIKDKVKLLHYLCF